MLETSKISNDLLLDIYKNMITSREIDILEQSFTARGEAFFHVSGEGHEGTAVLNSFLINDDWLHCHYRDKALMLARGITPLMFFHALFNKDSSHSRGRQMNAHMSAPELNILSLVGPVGNSALQAAGVAAATKEKKTKPITICSLGDGMSQQGEVLEAIAHSVRESLPVLYLIQDNNFAISTKTDGKTFYQHPSGKVNDFYGVPITYINGRYPEKAYFEFEKIVNKMREDRLPSIVVFEVDRLNSHTNADDHRVYREENEIEGVREEGDPIKNFKEYIITQGIKEKDLLKIQEDIKKKLVEDANNSQRSKDPEAIHDAVRPLSKKLKSTDSEYRGKPISEQKDDESLTMLEAIREVLDFQLNSDKKVLLFGEDIEDPKGDVFGITRGLTKKYPGRIKNSPLTESTIVGVSIGEALAGKKPVAFLQFADFLPIAFNQIISELGSMYWRTDGGWECPVIVMITCGGYKPGLGPFHASSMEGIAAHTPGVDVFMPSTAGDAAGLLNAAFDSKRPTLFFYPKSNLNNREQKTSIDIDKQLVPIGRARKVKEGNHITFVSWGNTIYHCLNVAEELEKEGVLSDVIDLRSLVPWDKELVLESVEKTRKLIVVHEDTHTAGMGSEVVSTIAELSKHKCKFRRVTRGDTYVPCNFENQLEVLPSFKRVLETAVDMLGGTVTWKKETAGDGSMFYIEAIGSSPSDESATVVSWHVKPGDSIKPGDFIADLEADKAAIELKSVGTGIIEELLIDEGETVKVGTPIAKVKQDSSQKGSEKPLKQITKEESGTPIINGIDVDLLSVKSEKSVSASNRTDTQIGIAAVSYSTGSRTVTNEEIVKTCTQWSIEDIVKRTGIETRQWLAEGETGLDLAVKACKDLFAKTGTTIQDIDAIICSTETPLMNTPSTSMLIHAELIKDNPNHECLAYDINAACSGYLYALQNAYDYLQSCPDHKVLICTVDILSNRLDNTDPSTAPIFGDACTASLIMGNGNSDKIAGVLDRPVLSAQGEDGEILRIPQDINKPVFMDGPQVYQKAVKAMISTLTQAMVNADLSLDDLDLIVPHQANLRIINAIQQRLKINPAKMYSNIQHFGNTSSSTIPICLAKILDQKKKPSKIGLTAFGGGFTYAGGILRLK